MGLDPTKKVLVPSLAKERRRAELAAHAALLALGFLTLAPFLFVLNNSFRSTVEQQKAFFGLPQAFAHMFSKTPVEVLDENLQRTLVPPEKCFSYFLNEVTRGYQLARGVLHVYLLNTFEVCLSVALGVVLMGSMVAYLLARYRFPGCRIVYFYIIATMMFPAVLMLVPSYMVVRELGLLNSFWALFFPYLAGGQVFAIFVFKGFFDGLPEELFESARLDGAGHFNLYTRIVLPLSKPVISVVAIMTILGAWNNFMWPFVTNTDGSFHVISSGLFVMTRTPVAQNPGTLYAAYVLSSLPLLLLFIAATKPFIQGVTSGAFKA